MKVFTIHEACDCTGLKEDTVTMYIEREWISPGLKVSEEPQLDEEDVARLQLILELQRDLGANDEAIPVILHLVDQLHYLRSQIQKGLSHQGV
jgi:chaperone modulatory protein CbpM